MPFSPWSSYWFNSTHSGRPSIIETGGSFGDGALPLPLIFDPIPFEPDGGIGDGAGPIPILSGPMPVEPDGGIGDGAKPLTPTGSENTPDEPYSPIGVDTVIIGGGKGTAGNDLFEATDGADTFVFESGQGDDSIVGFNLEQDTLDLTGTDLHDIKELTAASSQNFPFPTGAWDTDDGIVIKIGDGAYGFIEGISIDDLQTMTILYAE